MCLVFLFMNYDFVGSFLYPFSKRSEKNKKITLSKKKIESKIFFLSKARD